MVDWCWGISSDRRGKWLKCCHLGKVRSRGLKTLSKIYHLAVQLKSCFLAHGFSLCLNVTHGCELSFGDVLLETPLLKPVFIRFFAFKTQLVHHFFGPPHLLLSSHIPSREPLMPFHVALYELNSFPFFDVEPLQLIFVLFPLGCSTVRCRAIRRARWICINRLVGRPLVHGPTTAFFG